MGNPYNDTAHGNECVQNIMSRIWHCVDEAENPNALQVWSEVPGKSTSRVFSFDVNQRSGGDVWFADLLIACREGNMHDEDYRFLHGLPTIRCGSWLSKIDRSSCGDPYCATFQNRTKKLRSKSKADWFSEV